jgi:hypothetical protein
MCVDSKSRNVWVTVTLKSDVVEFAHGGTTPIETLTDGEGYVDGCAVSSVNGDLAIVNGTVGGDDPGNVVVFPRGSGTPATYSDRNAFLMYFPSYDPQGDLFVDASQYGRHERFRLDELLSGGKKLLNVPWQGPTIARPSNVQYADGNLAVGDANTGTIYQSSGGRIIGETTLNNPCYNGQFFMAQFYIERNKIVVPSLCKSVGQVFIYDYPAGGKAVKILSDAQFPYGAVVSR